MSPISKDPARGVFGSVIMDENRPTKRATGQDLLAWLEWYSLMGVVDLVSELPRDRFAEPEVDNAPMSEAQSQTVTRERQPGVSISAETTMSQEPPQWVLDHGEQSNQSGHTSTSSSSPQAKTSLSLDLGGAAQDARALAADCESLDAIAAALQTFEGCALKETAINLCFSDGNPESPIMLIGEAPGAQEDRKGKPFVGPSGQLLDRMLATIGLDRTKVYITNVIYWRPPGNRTPTAAEIAVCQPFLERQILLLKPKLLIFVGGIAARALLGVTQGVTKLRGRLFTYEATDGRQIPATVMFHPAYLLRQPAQKRYSWQDLLSIKEKINNF